MSELTLTKRPGSDRWYIRGTDNAGKPVFQSTRTTDDEAAKALLVKANARLLEEQVHGAVAVVTFEQAAAHYIKGGGERKFLLRQLGDGTYAGLMPHFGREKLLKDITQADLDKAADDLCPAGSRETKIRNVYTPFIAVWNHAAAASRRWAEPRKWERPRKAKGTAVRAEASRAGTRPVPYERAWQFVSAMSPAPAMLMTAFFYSGVRPIEFFALEESEVNVDGRWIVLINTKTGEPRGVPIHEMVVPLFAGLKARATRSECKRIFLNHHGEPYQITDSEAGINGQLKGAIKGARHRLADAGTPINDVSPYTGRHTVSTQLVMAGVHPHIKDQILGHAADDMSRHYTHVPQAPLIEAINRLPVVKEWAQAPWLLEPTKYESKLYSGVTGGLAEKIVEMREGGATQRNIAFELGISVGSVFAVLRDAGLTGTNAAKGRTRVTETEIEEDNERRVA